MSNKKDENKKIKIMVVEDDSFLSGMYKTKLEMEDFEVMLAGDGEKALVLLKKYQPDLILLDIILPKLSGFEVLKNIKKLKKTSLIPVIVLTNLSQREDVHKALSLGADDYLIKAHYMPSEVVDKIKSYLNI